MSYIIQVRDLIEDYQQSVFGYVGVELETGRIRYFTHYDDNQIYIGNKLYEFDINNPNTNILKCFLSRCDYKRETYSEELPKELEKVTEDAIEKHYNYNITNGYPTDIFDFNRKNLSIKYENGHSFFRSNCFSGIYTPVENVIGISVNKHNWQKSTEEEKEGFKNTILHEVGHMKISSIELDVENNKLYVRTGFYTSVITFDQIVLSNGDIFLKFINSMDLAKFGTEKILEEIMNDFECKLVYPKFVGVYPNYGKNFK